MPTHPVAAALKVFARRLRGNPAVRITEHFEGAAAPAALVAGARAASSTPGELLELHAAMDGFRLEWTLAGRARREHSGIGGRVELPALARRADGDRGFWDGDGFTAEGLTLESYVEAGLRNLFVHGWLEHVMAEGPSSVCPAAVEARQILGFGSDEDLASMPRAGVDAPARPGRREPRRLVLDDDPARLEVFRELLPGCVTVESYAEAVAALSGRRFSEVYLDHDIVGRETGADVAAWMADELPASKRPRIVVVHSWNKPGALDMGTTLRGAGFNVDTRPFEFPSEASPRPRGFLTGLVIPPSPPPRGGRRKRR